MTEEEKKPRNLAETLKQVGNRRETGQLGPILKREEINATIRRSAHFTEQTGGNESEEKAAKVKPARRRKQASSADSTRLTVTLPQDEYEFLKNYAQEEDRSIAWVIRKAINKLRSS